MPAPQPTPGPYHVEEAGAKYAVCGCKQRLAIFERLADADLYVAAPDMREALKAILSAHPDCETTAQEVAWQMAADALAKANGC